MTSMLTFLFHIEAYAISAEKPEQHERSVSHMSGIGKIKERLLIARRMTNLIHAL